MWKFILGAVILFFVFLFWLPVSVRFCYRDEQVVIKLQVLFFSKRLYPAKEKKKKKSKVKTKATASAKETKKLSLKEKAEPYMALLRSLPQPLSWLLSKVRISKLDVRLSVVGEDAAQTAITYGNTCAFVYGLLALLQNFFTVFVKKISIKPDFLGEKQQIYISGKARLRVVHGCLFGIKFILFYLKQNKSSRMVKQKA